VLEPSATGFTHEGSYHFGFVGEVHVIGEPYHISKLSLALLTSNTLINCLRIFLPDSFFGRHLLPWYPGDLLKIHFSYLKVLLDVSLERLSLPLQLGKSL
jgi:hypothetical protein